MALIRWEPVAELNTIQNEMNRLFNTYFDQPDQTGRGNGMMRRWLPPMDLVETTDHYVLRADLPGLSDGDVNVQLEDNVLTISGERKAEHAGKQEGYYRLERAFGGFSRSLTLPDGINPDGIQAHFDRGVLEIRIPKPEQKKPRTVQINLGASPDANTIESGNAEANSHDPVPTAA
jgi:HSP20 family protein